MPYDTPIEEYVELAGGRVHMFRGGTGEPLLFLHAAGGAGTWLEFHGRLADAGFEVLAPDHPGFAKSDDFPLVEAMDDLVYHYLDLLDALRLDRVHLVGASFGGWIAAELAVAASHRLRSVTLLSAAGLRLPDHPVPDLFLMPPTRLAETLYHDPPPAPEGSAAGPDIDAVLAAYRDSTALARFCWAPYLSNPKLERRLHRVSVPALVVAPSDDRLIPVAHARRYAALIPGARFTEVPDSGHAMYFERPAEFAAAVTGFLQSSPSGPSRASRGGSLSGADQ